MGDFWGPGGVLFIDLCGGYIGVYFIITVMLYTCVSCTLCIFSTFHNKKC